MPDIDDSFLEALEAAEIGGIDTELEQKFEEMCATQDMLEYWYPAINPKVVGMDDIRKAALLTIASHVDKHGDRGRLHLLMYGDPGTAKSIITNWIVFHLNAVGASMRSSRVGLTADASGSEIELGALPRANDGIICLDELDKFDQKSLQGLLEALEEGQIRIDVGKIHATIDARVRCLACANDTSRFSPELMDRFDFKFEVLKPDRDFKREIMRSTVLNWFKPKDGYDGVNLRNYLRWIEGFEPGIDNGTRVSMVKLMEMYLVLTESDGSIREEESMIRIAITLAKLHRRDVQAEDLLKAIRLKHPELNNGKIELLERILEE